MYDFTYKRTFVIFAYSPLSNIETQGGFSKITMFLARHTILPYSD